MIKELYRTVGNAIVSTIGKVCWDKLAIATKGRYYDLTTEEQNEIRELLRANYYIILTRRKTHLSTYAINFSHFVLSRFRHFGYYSHALMNLEDAVKTDDDFRLMEATGKKGAGFASFDTVFDCDSVALLKPKKLSVEEWTAVLDKAKEQDGKPYDTLYDLADANSISCVELVRVALMAEPNYAEDFPHFERTIAHAKNLDPHMFYECEDFEVVWERRH